MKTKTPAVINDPTKKIPEGVIRHLQSMTDDVRGILAGGLSFFDKQLPFEYREISVTSASPFYVTMQSPYTIKGCIPIQTNGVAITSYQTDIASNRFSVTLTMSQSTATIGFLLIGVLG